MKKPSSLTKSNQLQTRIALLLSGGIDSAATLAVYFRQKAHIDAVFFDYGQPARRSEWEAAQAIAAHYNVNLRRIRLGVRLPGNNRNNRGRE